jgi:hypothetical protein
VTTAGPFPHRLTSQQVPLGYEAWDLHECGERQMLLGPSSLLKNPLRLSRTRQNYELSSKYSLFRGIARERYPDAYYETKVRLRSDIHPEAKKVNIQPVSYLESLASNEFASYRFHDASKGRRLTVESMFLSPSGSLLPLSESVCSNHLGVSALVLTSDSYVVLAVQDFSAALYPRQLVASISCSLDWADTKYCYSLQQALAKGLKREGLDECGAKIQKIKWLGLGRDLYRGGKPDVYSLAETKSRFKDLKPQESYIAKLISIPVDRYNLSRDIREGLKDQAIKISSSLEASLLLLEQEEDRKL